MSSGGVAEAAAWRLLSCLLERPRPGWSEEVLALAREVPSRELAACASKVAREGTEGKYPALLGPGGRISPREVSYRPRRDPGALLAGLRVLYEAFAFRPDTEEPPDHIAVELSFLIYLKLKEAFAVAQDHHQAAVRVREAVQVLEREHLEGFVRPLGEALAKSGSYLAELGGILVALPSGRDPFVAKGAVGT